MAAVNVQNRVSMAQGLLPAEVTQDRCDYSETSELHVGCILSL